MNKFLSFTILAGIFVVPFIVFIVAPTLFFPFITGKNFAFRIITEIIFGLWVILALREAQYRPKFSWILASFATFLGIIALADIFGQNPIRSFWSNYERMEGLITLIHLFAYFLVLGSVVNTGKLWSNFFHTYLATSAIMSVYGLFQLSGVFNINQGGVRVDGTLGNATYLAIFLVFNFFICLLLLLRSERSLFFELPWKLFIILGAVFGLIVLIQANVADPQTGLSNLGSRLLYQLPHGGLWNMLFVFVLLAYFALAFMRRYYVYFLTVILGLIVLYHTATRGAILGLIGGLAISALLIAIFDRGSNLRKIAIGGIIAVAVIVLGFIAIKNTNFVQKSPVLQRFATISWNETKTQARSYVWPMAIQGFKERPILGWGQENFNYVFNKYYDPRMYTQEPWFDRTHNVFLDWLIDGGILGLLGYLSLYSLALYAVWRRGDLSFAERAVITGLFAAYLFHNIFVFDNLISYLLFMMFLAYLHFDVARPFSEKVSKIFSSLYSNQTVVNRYVAPVIVILVFYGVYFFNAKPIVANTTLISAMSGERQMSVPDRLGIYKKAINYNTFGSQEIREQLIQAAFSLRNAQGVDLKEKQAFIEFTRSEYEKMIAQIPDDARHRLFLGMFLNVYGDYGDALVQLQKAREFSPKKQSILFEIVNDYISAGDYGEALKMAKIAFDLEPNYNDARIIYAATAIYAGRNDLAKDLLISKFGTVSHPDDRLLRAYFDTGQFNRIMEIWQNRVKENPLEARSHFALAAAYVKVGRDAEAVAELAKAKELETDEQKKAQYQQIIDDIRAGKNVLQ
ncbi:MAG: O-antigen ligase family protein [bacterium]|nr:O-antigen ligase family protein [bacterium]